MKSKSNESIEKISNHIFEKFRYYINKYHVANKISLTIYPYNDDKISECVRCTSGVAVSSFDVLYNDDKIIYDVNSSIFIPVENIFKKFIDFNLNYYYCTEYFDMILLHEIGHIIYTRKNFIGKLLDEWDKFNENNKELGLHIPYLRKNASIKTRIDWIKKYFSLPAEKGANDSVRISTDDIIHIEIKSLINK